MGSINVSVSGDTNTLFKQLKKYEEVDTAGTMRAIAEGLRTSTMERFDKSLSPEGKKWKTSIRASIDGGKTLVKTTELKTSIRAEADKSGLAVGTNNIYAATHQFGVSRRTIQPRKAKVLRFQIGGKWVSARKVTISIPARPFLGISEEDDAEIKDMLNEMMGG